MVSATIQVLLRITYVNFVLHLLVIPLTSLL